MDYISREDANRILYDLGVCEVYKLPSFWCHGGKDYQVIPTKYHNGYQQALADADEHIKGIPAADVVERKVGYWVGADDQKVSLNENGETQGSAWCFVCGEWLTASDEYATKGRYCPNCGAKMEDNE